MKKMKRIIHKGQVHVFWVAMAKAILVIDENVAYLKNPLRANNFKVIIPPSSMSDDMIKSDLLAHRILITKSQKAFSEDATTHEYGIVSLEKLKFVDPSVEDNNSTAKEISKALSKFKLLSAKNFLLTLRDDGKHKLEWLE